MSGLDDVTKKAQEFLNSDQVKGLKSEQAEDISDKLLLADAANKVTGKFESQIDGAKSADKSSAPTTLSWLQ